MIHNEDTALQIADYLLQIKAIKLQPDNPFQWASGWKSPIYCDNRKTLSHPTIRTFIRQKMVEAIEAHFSKPNGIAGVATGGIAQGALVAQELGVPFCYVRSGKKGHGLQNQIEGDIAQGSNLVVIEDLVSTGGSSLEAVEALRAAGYNINGMVSIFTYGFDKAQENFEKNGVELISLSDYDHLLKQAIKADFISEDDVASLQDWRNAPQNWKAQS